MPNFWTQATQKVYEAFYGPRTKDTEFDIKVEEMKAAERNFNGIKAIIHNFNRHTSGLKAMCKEVYTNLAHVYGENSAYWPLIVEICQAHQEIERQYDLMVEIVSNLQRQTLEWDRHFDEAKKNINEREEYRKVYDHYDEKMEKFIRARNDKSYKGQQETAHEAEAFERNEVKYKQAADDFVKQSGYTFNLIQELLDFRYNLINPAVTTFVMEEKKFFSVVSDLFKKFDNLQGQVQAIDRKYTKTKITYDPTKYIRGHKLLSGGNPYDPPKDRPRPSESIQTQNFTYEEYLKSRKQGGSSVIQQPVVSESTTQENPGGFSYEQYKKNHMQKSPQNAPSEFSQYQNNYSSSQSSFLNFDINNKPSSDSLKKTTVMPQNDFNLIKDQQPQDTYNPYSSLTFNDIQQPNFPTSNFGQYAGNNQSQFNNHFNPGSNPQVNEYSRSNFNFPTQQDIGNYPGSKSQMPPKDNLKFPR